MKPRPQNWKTQFGSTYFDEIDSSVVDALNKLEDVSYRHDDLPSFVLSEVEIDGDKYSLRAWAGFDEEDHNQDIFVFSLGLNINDEYQSDYTQDIAGLFDHISTMCTIDSEKTSTNNHYIIELIKRTQAQFPQELIDYIKSDVIEEN